MALKRNDQIEDGGDIMGIERIVYHSVRCDKCRILLDSYKEELPRLRPNRTVAAKVASEHGFIKTESNVWLCPKCAAKESCY